MKKLILFGASNFGDEIVQLFRDINKASETPIWDIMGFLDDNPSIVGNERNGIKILGTKDWFDVNTYNDCYFLCVIGNPKSKEKVVNFLNSKGVNYASGIHPSVIISPTSTVGDGTVITAGNIITTNVSVENHIIINLACTIGHYTKIGNYCTINPGVNISGDVTLNSGVYIGTNATILEKITIEEFSIIGAGAVVNKNIPANVTAVGIPAKIIKGN